MKTLAREGLYSRRTIQELKGEIELWKDRYNKVVERLKDLYEETRDMRVAFQILPEKIKETIANIFGSNRISAEKEKAYDNKCFDREIRNLYEKVIENNEQIRER